MKIKDNLDLQGYLLQNFCVDNYDSLDSISNKGDGRMVFLTGNSTDAKYRHVNVWDGTNFKALAYLEDVAMNDDFIALQEKVDSIDEMLNLESSQTVIDTWEEVKAFLDSVPEGLELMDLLNGKLDRTGGTIEGTIAEPLQIKSSNASCYINFQGSRAYMGYSSTGSAFIQFGSSSTLAVKADGAYYNSNKILTSAGGTLTGALTMSGASARIKMNGCLLEFNDANGNFGAFIGLSDSKLSVYDGSTFNAILHAGNYSDYAIKINKAISLENDVNVAGYGTTDSGWGENGAAYIIGYSKDYRLALQAFYEGNAHSIKTRYCGNGTWRGDWKTIAFTDSDITGYAAGLKHSNGTVGATVDANGNVSFNGAGVIQIDGNEVIGKHSSFYIGYQTAVKDGLATRIWGKGFQFSNEAGAHRMIINESGNVTIGATDKLTNSATTKLYVDGGIRFAPRTIWGKSFDGTGNVTGNLNLGEGTLVSAKSGANEVVIDFGSAGDPYLGFGTARAGLSSHICGNDIYLRYGTSHTTGLFLNSSGNVTIGARDLAETNVKLYVSGPTTTSLLRFINNDNTTGSYIGRPSSGHDNILLYIPTANDFYIATNGEERMRVKANGNVLIGATEDNGAKLQVNGDISLTDYAYIKYNTAGNFAVVDNSQNKRFLICNPNGLFIGLETTDRATLITGSAITLGVNTTINGNLHVTGNIIADGEVSAGGAGEEGETEGGGGREPWASDPFAITSTTMEFSHNLGTDNVIVQVYEQDATSGHWSMILVDVEIIDNANIALHFGRTESTIHKVIVMG